MKKISLLLLCICLLLPLTACGNGTEAPGGTPHTHTAAVGYGYDDTHHWNPCTVGDCNIKLNWKAHTLDGGEITALPTEGADGVRTYRCTCGYTETEPVDHVEVNDTLFDAALFESTFANVTVQVKATEQAGDATLTTDVVLCFDGALMSMAGTVRGEQVSATVSDAAVIESYKSVLLYCRRLNSEDLTFDKESACYRTDRVIELMDTASAMWYFSNVGIKLKGDRITYAVCDYRTAFGDGRTGHLELTFSRYGETNLQ